MQNALGLIMDILSQKTDNVALLKRLLAKQDDLRDISEDMEDIETFFKSQKSIFDTAQRLYDSLQNEQDYFVTTPSTNEKINEIAIILVMKKPYARIKDLSELMQNIKATYEVLLKQKRDEVLGIVQQCMGDIHTLAGAGNKVKDFVIQADDRFSEYKQKASNANSLTVLDAMITQMLNYKDQVCRRMEAIIGDEPPIKPGETPRKQKIVQVRRYDVFPTKRLTTRAEVDNYLESIRKKLYEVLQTNDGVQIS